MVPSDRANSSPIRSRRAAASGVSEVPLASIQWAEAASPEDYRLACRYLGKSENESICSAMIRVGMSSVSDTFIVQMQDWLELGQEGRMNTPGTLSEKNWSWRLSALPDKALTAQIAAMTGLYGRLPRREGT